jgi:hypothetical protein
MSRRHRDLEPSPRLHGTSGALKRDNGETIRKRASMTLQLVIGRPPLELWVEDNHKICSHPRYPSFNTKLRQVAARLRLTILDSDHGAGI